MVSGGSLSDGSEVRAVRARHAMDRPRPALRVEGAMPQGMPVARGIDRQALRLESVDITVEHRHHLVAARHRQGSARQEIVLDVRDQQYIARLQLPAFRFG